ncbi:phosphatidylglycerophosphatase A family protein [Parendozoicomonas haliclonae]|uniref:Phosphatidylglycerophosphatase A n=1 Tax=Parendozoicomonas haliclonae TaxID=1960125 RepID=A0A1X7AMJ5_9GAMM|nr:phosphatidylglycerophosphatase A [Parendozoicomonas haliclonae]SMA49499.1 Phosphatidylglycerophosphatase A [Parendozoicomonas haliclonae]
MNKPQLSNPVHLLAFGFGSGMAPKAPGTFGTLAAIPFFLLMQGLSLPVYIGIVVVASLVGIYLCGKTSEDMGVHDHGGIVWDEFCGFWITMIAAPTGWMWIVIGFLLFRLFDIWKPWPVKVADEKVHGGLGIMLDDLIAGVYAFLVMQVLIALWG